MAVIEEEGKKTKSFKVDKHDDMFKSAIAVIKEEEEPVFMNVGLAQKDSKSAGSS